MSSKFACLCGKYRDASYPQSNYSIEIIIYRKILKMVEADRLETIIEIQMLKKLNRKSPYIIDYFEDFKFSLFHCIITEYCSHGDLQVWIERYKVEGRKFQASQINEWCCDITEGLVYLHENGIIHRDIKPG
jgi:serine/threonine protein kinase